MLKAHIYGYWLVAAVCFLTYIEVCQTDDDVIDLDLLPLDNYTAEFKVIAPPKSLSGWYKLTNGFLSVIHPRSSETIYNVLELMKGKIAKLPLFLYEMIKAQYAFVACVTIGIFFAVVISITGLTFFCCRMCGNCGGKRVQVIKSSTSVWRTVFILSLIILLAFILTAAITLFIINGSLNTSFVETEKTVHTSLHDAEIFLNNTQKQVSYLAFTGVNTAVDGITEKIKNVQTFIEEKLKVFDVTQSLQEAKVPLLGWLNIAASVGKAIEVTKSIESLNQNSRIVDILADLQEKLKRLKDQCKDENCQKVKPDVFTLDNSVPIDVNSSLNEIISKLQNLKKEDYEKILHDIVKSMKSIPIEITQETASIRNAVIKDLNEYRVEVLTGDLLKGLENFTDMARNEIHEVQKKIPDARRYDKYRWYFGLSVGIIIAIVAGGLFFGLFSGIYGHRHNKQATKRTTLSNGAGLILMFTVYWMFLFSGLLMLLTTFMFIAGGVAEVYVCRPLFDDDFKVFDQVMDVFRQNTNPSELGILENIVPSVALRNCSNGSTLYEAFNLESMNISSSFDYEKKLKLDERLQELQNIRFPEPVFITTHAEKAFAELDEALNINMTEEITKVRENTIKEYEEQLNIILNINDPSMEEINSTIAQVGNYLTSFEQLRMGLLQLLSGISDGSSKLKARAIQTEQQFNETEKMLKELIPRMSKDYIKEFVEELKAYGDGIIQNVLENFERKLLTCKPLWNIFDSVRTVVCKYYVLPLNGIWFAIGWSVFFFIPTIIVCTKLSKHFFKMDYVTTSEKAEKSAYDLELTTGCKTKSDNGWYSPSHHL